MQKMNEPVHEEGVAALLFSAENDDLFDDQDFEAINDYI